MKGREGMAELDLYVGRRSELIRNTDNGLVISQYHRIAMTPEKEANPNCKSPTYL
jgi:hypothetical protein